MKRRNTDTTGLDRFYTPDKLASAIVRRYIERRELTEADVILEPSSGMGAFARAIREQLPRATLFTNDIDPHVSCPESDSHLTLDFAKLGQGDDPPELWVVTAIIGNPPFSEAIDHIEAALRILSPSAERTGKAGLLGFVLPLQFIRCNSQKNERRTRAWWATHCPQRVETISPRPSFCDDGSTDARDVALYTWDTEELEHDSYRGGWLHNESGWR